MRKITAILLFLCVVTAAKAQFDRYFTDETLRIDFTLTGNNVFANISLDKLNKMPGWYGKRMRLAEVPMEGNGTLTLKNHAGEVIYKQSFSTLFQEWVTYDEAKTTTRSFESVMLVPMPKEPVVVEMELRNSAQVPQASFACEIDPKDILIRHIGERNHYPYETVVAAKDFNNSIKVAFVAEGYTEEEMGTFMNDVAEAVDALFSHEPFSIYKERFNIVAVKSASQESGTSIPHKGVWKNTVLSSHFDTFYSERYLTTLAQKDLHNVLAGVPYEHIIVLVNTDNYGGGGILNSYNLSMTHHPMYRPVVVHEFGHSFAGLADEYAYEQEAIPMYPHDIEPWEPNITTLVNFDAKWKDMTEKKSPAYNKRVSLHEGAGYSLKGVYRPTEDCRMRTNTNPEFCPVCCRAIEDVITFYTGK